MDSILDIEDLSVGFDTQDGEIQAVRGVSFSLKRGEILAVIGESGCGKSVLCQSILKLLPKNGHIKSGKILVDGIDITDFKEKDMKNIRGNLISMVFQDPLTTLNPTMPIGKQITEALLKHKKSAKKKQKSVR